METNFAVSVGRGFTPIPQDSVRDSLFAQYERVLMESLITSFGLDALIKDRHGGDVDTLHTVRQIGKDGEMTYKSEAHRQAYENRGDYDAATYHSHKAYREKNRQVSAMRKEGNLVDAYTGEVIPRNGKTDLDHVISAKEIHEDRGRVLAGLCGEDLANSQENLQATNRRTNRSKKADSMDEFLARKGDEYTEEQKALMRKRDTEARRAYERRLAITYYSSADFWTHTAAAAGRVGLQMGLRQALGLVLTEVWFAIRERLTAGGRSLKAMLADVAEGVGIGMRRAREKFADLLARLGEGIVSGILASLTTTLCNIFFTTAKNMVRILRQSFASIVAAGKVLLFNPDNLAFGDRLLAALKILATGASTVVGMLLAEAVAASGLGNVPVVGELLVSFTGVFATGVLSCTLLYALDSCDIIQRVIAVLNTVHTIEYDIVFYRQQAEAFETLAAQLLAYDLDGFKRETAAYADAARRLLHAADDPQVLDGILREILTERGIALPYDGDFDSFMASGKGALHFS